MEPVDFEEIRLRFDEWLEQGYGIIADDVDGELRVTVYHVHRAGEPASEREQEFWPMLPELVELLEQNGVVISRALAGPG
ncbi:MAG: hypothetical protein M5U22_07320 [Thermoleophilia bacterium]|nr:hypothetical protein [Thermoleophilia bacterium]